MTPIRSRKIFRIWSRQQLTAINATRLIGAIQNRVGEQLPWQSPLPSDWDELEEIILRPRAKVLSARRNALSHRSNAIWIPCSSVSQRIPKSAKLRLLLTLSYGTRVTFDQKTHKQVKQAFMRFSYVFLAAQLLDGREAQDIDEDVMDHLEDGGRESARHLGTVRVYALESERRQTCGLRTRGANRFRGESAQRSSIRLE